PLPDAVTRLPPFAPPPLFFLAPPIAHYAAIFNLTTPLSRAAVGVWLLVVWTGAWGAFTTYYLNLWVLTSQRIVNIKQYRFFSRSVSSLFLSRIQDVTSDVSGFLASLLDIGNIKAQSAAEEVEFVMRGIQHPEQMRDLILKYVQEED